MQYKLRSTRKFDRRLGALLARLEECDEEIRGNLKAIAGRLMNGDLTGSKLHHADWDETRCVPLVDRYVVVFRVEENGPVPNSILLMTVEED